MKKKWSGATACAIDEISVLAPQGLYQIDQRSRQITDKNTVMGGMAVNISGDFLQLPPVEAPSLARPLDDHGYARMFEDEAPTKTTKEEAKKQRTEMEHRLGYDLWSESFLAVTSLELNMRTEGPLAEILQGMRAGRLSDAAWAALQDRVLRGDDTRMQQPPFTTNPVHYIVQRHQLRVSQSFCNAVRDSVRLERRLYISVACDEPKLKKGDVASAELAEAFLRESNLRKVKNLPSVLPLFRGMRLLLYDKICARLLLMNGCQCILEDVLFDADEVVPPAVHAGDPVVLNYLPSHLLLRAVDAPWTLPEDQLPPLPDEMDRKVSSGPRNDDDDGDDDDDDEGPDDRKKHAGLNGHAGQNGHTSQNGHAGQKRPCELKRPRGFERTCG